MAHCTTRVRDEAALARARSGDIRDIRIATGPCGSLAARVVIDGVATSDDPPAPPRHWWRACRALEIAVESLRRNPGAEEAGAKR